jgi:hypothetical protein
MIAAPISLGGGSRTLGIAKPTVTSCQSASAQSPSSTGARRRMAVPRSLVHRTAICSSSRQKTIQRRMAPTQMPSAALPVAPARIRA